MDADQGYPMFIGDLFGLVPLFENADGSVTIGFPTRGENDGR